jgi:predicted transcriptional regulator
MNVVDKQQRLPAGAVYNPCAGDLPGALERVLGSLERAIMEDVWENGPSSVRQVLERIKNTHNVAYTTVMTVMNRLVQKDLLETLKTSRAYSYRATKSREDFLWCAAGKMVDSLINDFGDIARARFLLEIDKADPSRLVAIRQLRERDHD